MKTDCNHWFRGQDSETHIEGHHNCQDLSYISELSGCKPTSAVHKPSSGTDTRQQELNKIKKQMKKVIRREV